MQGLLPGITRVHVEERTCMVEVEYDETLVSVEEIASVLGRLSPLPAATTASATRATFLVTGMTCASCATLLESCVLACRG